VIRRLLNYWIGIWDLKEHPRSLAVIRICLGLVILFDALEVLRRGLVVPLMGVLDAGGWSSVLLRPNIPLWYQYLPAEPSSAYLLWAGIFTTALCFTLGIFPRISAVGFVLLSAQWNQILPQADRGIDTLVRNAMLIMAVSQCGRTLSLQALWKTGSIYGDGEDVQAWPRHLVICQLVLMYFMTGVQKFGLSWTPFGYYSALYIILQDYAIIRMDFSWLVNQPFYLFTQLSSAITVFWQWSYPIVLLFFHYRLTPDRPGRFRAFAVKYHLHWVWVAVGAVFHLLIAATMELGIFPWAMLALYPAFVHPTEWRWIREKLRLA